MLSQTTEYALRATVTLAKHAGSAKTAQELAEITLVPAGYMSKVLLGLAKAGIVQSQRGLGGGFTLARPVADITILDVVNVFDPLRPVETCPLGLPEHAQLCPLHRRLRDAVTSLVEVFGRTTLADLLSEERAGMCDPITAARKAAEGAESPCACRDAEHAASPIAQLRPTLKRLKNPA